jgi:predicted nucleotidyltransferase
MRREERRMKPFSQIKAENPEIFQNSILTAYRGSHSHGTFVPSTDENSIDDIDLMSICIPSRSYYFGLDTFGSRDTLEIKDGPWDIVAYEIRKFVRLLMKGNPNVIGILWLRPKDYFKLDQAGHLLLDFRKLFNSQAVYHSFLGYSNAQFYKMEHLAHKGYMGEKRKRLVEKYGYDCKNAAHLIRLMRMCNEWLETHEFQVYRPDAEQLIEIKTGKWSLEEVKKEAGKLFARGEELFEKNKDRLPKEVDRNSVNDLLLEMFKNYA